MALVSYRLPHLTVLPAYYLGIFEYKTGVSRSNRRNWLQISAFLAVIGWFFGYLWGRSPAGGYPSLLINHQAYLFARFFILFFLIFSAVFPWGIEFGVVFFCCFCVRCLGYRGWRELPSHCVVVCEVVCSAAARVLIETARVSFLDMI